ncbi:hypothetical protein GCM10009850_018240 [Nonomuraea monospora]|uniref:HTH araC/xylS-type domain-containing protein n=1 Tax=Nonomuraea monospora TaxID=568818 RepID=A0ABP5P3J4_9ACTN
MYVERPPSAGLAGRIACGWHRVSEAAATQLVVPDACVDLIWGAEGLYVAGPDTGPMPAAIAAGETLTGVRFKPGAVGDFFGLPLKELRDRRVPLRDLPVGASLLAELTKVAAPPKPNSTRRRRAHAAHADALVAPETVTLVAPDPVALAAPEAVGLAAPEAVALAAPEAVGLVAPEAVALAAPEAVGLVAPDPVALAARDAGGLVASEAVALAGPEAIALVASDAVALPALRAQAEARLQLMQAAMASRLSPPTAAAPSADPAAPAIATALGKGRSVAEVAWDLGYSERQLHRRSLLAFGYAPKTLQRIVRFQHALRLARAGVPLAQVAITAGYADQAHLSNDVKRLSGVQMSHLL